MVRMLYFIKINSWDDDSITLSFNMNFFNLQWQVVFLIL